MVIYPEGRELPGLPAGKKDVETERKKDVPDWAFIPVLPSGIDWAFRPDYGTRSRRGGCLRQRDSDWAFIPAVRKDRKKKERKPPEPYGSPGSASGGGS